MDYKVHKNRRGGELSRNGYRSNETCLRRGKKAGKQVHHYLSLKKRRILKYVKDLAEVELLLSTIYVSLVVVSTMEPIAQELAARLPQIKAGSIWAIAGLLIWGVADRIERYLKKSIKK